MTTFNVQVPVVALVEATSAEDAVNLLMRQLEEAGFDVAYARDSHAASASESEPLS